MKGGIQPMVEQNTNYKRVPIDNGQEFMIAIDGKIVAKGTTTFDAELSVYVRHRGENKVIWSDKD
jgi:hypothetical protein